ncbi:hypothetical protein [Corynebacterium aquilae]|uniref:Secreted protein n=1 Tax=Corynebacterium aquilae DSM 44791 TaxID=1431546 RepID=A0A1L7CF21_9CORY|nr:hypothetical protein [Corynebacterium aquilae]APT84424.1 hypothetical protein CAQU_04350 [Corynebacterium aquilae DSM 44791]
MIKRVLASAAAAAIATASLATPAHAANEATILGLVIGTNTANALTCDDTKALLEGFGLLDPNDTRESLRTKTATKIAAVAGQLDQSGVVGAKVSTDLAARADECGLVKKDQLSQLSSQMGSSEMSKLGDMAAILGPLLKQQ